MHHRKKIIVLTGAGISAESGINTFRDAGGLWEGHDVMEVASIEGWHKNPELVLDFYNQRRKQLQYVSPNPAHFAIAHLEKFFEVIVVTQNVDNLHERAGSSNVMHLHGELLKVRSSGNPNLIYDWDEDLCLGDFCDEGHQLRPHIVRFGESVPMIPQAISLVQKADIFIIVGTSLQVYPASGLIDYVKPDTPIYLVDPKANEIKSHHRVHAFAEKAGIALPEIANQLIQNHA